MALDGTYSGLQASVASWLNRADLTAYIPDWIIAAESALQRRFIKEGGIRPMLTRADATLNAEYITVPTDFAGSNTIWVSGAQTPTGYQELVYCTPQQINELKTFQTGTGQTLQFFTVIGNSFQFWPWFGATVPAELTYIARIPSLASNPTGNWLSLSHPDAYLYTTLLQSAPFLKNDARLNTWGAFATNIVEDIVQADKVERKAYHIAIPLRPVV